jgi:hypothetical protein
MQRALLGVSLALFLAAIAAAQYAYRVSTDTGDAPVAEAWAQNKMEFVAWNNEQWTAWIHDGMFEHAPENSADWSRHSKASVAFTGWDGEALQAKIEGDLFLIAHQGNWEDSVDRSDALRYRDWSGNNQIRTVAELLR